MWVPVSSIGKISDDWIRDLRFNHYLHKKAWSDDKELSSEANVLGWNFLKKWYFINYPFWFISNRIIIVESSMRNSSHK